MVAATSSSKFYTYLALGSGVFIIGFSPIFVRLADAPGTITAFYRIAIAAVLIALPFLQQVKIQEKQLPRRGVWLALLGGLFFGLDLAFWSTGIVLSGATNPTLMANTAPIWVGLGALLIFREQQNTAFWIGLVMAMVGAAIVLGEDLSRASNLGLGTFFGLLAAIFYGAYYLVTERGRTSLNTLTYFWLTMMSASLLLLVVNLIFGNAFTGYSSNTYLIFLTVGVVVQAVGWMVINYAQGYLPASVVAPTLLGQPVVTALFAGPLLSETLSVWHIAGGVIVLAGVYLVHRSRRKT